MMGAEHDLNKKTKQSRPRSQSHGTASDQAISTPVLLFTDAESRDDLFTLSSQFHEAGPRPCTADDSAKSKASTKKTHLADLVADRPSMSSVRNPHGLHLRQPQDYETFSNAGIGVALGSPSQSPWMQSEPTGSFTSFSTRGPSPLGVSPPAVPTSAYPFLDEPGKERGKWKIFGGLFGKKAASSPATPGTPFYKVQLPKPEIPARQTATTNPRAGWRHQRAPSRSLEIVSSTVSDFPLPNTAKSIPISKNSAAKRTTSPLAVRTNVLSAQTEPSTASVQPPSRPRDSSPPAQFPMPPLASARPTRVPTPPPKDFPSKAARSPPRRATDTHIATITRGPPNFEPATKLKPMLLEIDIPDVAMERYSIMFSDVLKPRQSLLARRQGQLKQLKVGDAVKEDKILEDVEKPIPIRRATAPSPKSPRFSMFPTPPTSHGRTTPGHLKPVTLQRSATAPSASPSRAEFSIRLYPKRQDSHLITSTYSPSHNSDTPASLHYEWPSDASPTSTEMSEEEGFYKIEENGPNIVIQSPDAVSLQQRHSYDNTSIVEEPQNVETFSDLIKQPQSLLIGINKEVANQTNQFQSQPQRTRGLSLQDKALPSPATRRKQSISKFANHTPDRFRQMVQPNPLQSSPASPGEVRIARQLSLSRRQQMLVPITPRAVKQRQQAVIVTPEDEPQEFIPRARGASVTAHTRNKSELVVLDSV